MIIKLSVLFGFSVLFALAAGCDGGSDRNGGGAQEVKSPEVEVHAPEAHEDLRRRVADRWDALMLRDYGAAWEFLTPATRETMPRELYHARNQLKVYRDRRYTINSVECRDDDHCEVVVQVEGVYEGSISVSQGRFENRIVKERWLRKGGQWYIVEL